VRRGLLLPYAQEGTVADLIVRDVDEELVAALTARAEAHGRSPEAEHRAILYAALKPPSVGDSLMDWLRAMPELTDEELERPRDLPRE